MKVLLFAVLGIVAVVVLLALSPLVLVYFLFDRLCSTIEDFRPRTTRRKPNADGDQRKKMLQKVFAIIAKNAPTNNQAGG